MLADSLPFLVISNLGEGPLEERIDTFVAARVRTLQIMRPFRHAARTRFAASESIPAVLAVTTQLARNQISDQFAPELGRLDETAAQQLVDAILLVTSADSYESLTDQLDRSIDSVKATWTGILRTILDAAPGA